MEASAWRAEQKALGLLTSSDEDDEDEAQGELGEEKVNNEEENDNEEEDDEQEDDEQEEDAEEDEDADEDEDEDEAHDVLAPLAGWDDEAACGLFDTPVRNEIGMP